uniref:L-type lectin-like domain-containing protein n=1 Tax=Parastrongyloides trichosuri TaxID=131310 RepID=A0A0N4ZKD3_PARTI
MPTHRKFEYKHSFRAPNLSQRDGSIPFWTITGDAIASSDQLRIAPSIKSRRGIAWNKKPFTESEFFEIETAIKITGQRLGADGLAIWYTAQPGTLGPVYGSNDQWNGLGIFLDSYDNDDQKNNPYISAMVNDGTRIYDHASDGSTQILAGCQKNFRNQPYPVRIKIEYYNNILTVLISDGQTTQTRYEMCLRVENVFLPKNGYFGVSAATGGLADDHDILEFSTYSLHTKPPTPEIHEIPRDEKEKYDAEFERQREQFEKEREKFKKEHPEKAAQDEEDAAKYYEDATARELRLIHETQSAIHMIMQNMENKLKEIQNTQNTHTSMIQSGGQHTPQQGTGQVQQVAPGGFQQHEKQEVIQQLRDLMNTVRDMKNYVNEVYTKTFNMENKINANAAAQQTINPTLQQQLNLIQDDLSKVSRGFATGQGKPSTDCPSCVGSTFFLIIIAVQSAAIVIVIYLRSKETKAKFY